MTIDHVPEIHTITCKHGLRYACVVAVKAGQGFVREAEFVIEANHTVCIGSNRYGCFFISFSSCRSRHGKRFERRYKED